MRHTGLTSEGVARNRRGHLRERRGLKGEGEVLKSKLPCCCPAEQKIRVQWGDYTCRCSHIYDKVDRENRENDERWLPWCSLVSVLTSQVSFVLKHVRYVTSTAVPVLPHHSPPCPPSSAISLSLMPSAVGSEMQAWPRLQPQAPNLLWLEKNSVAPSHRGKQQSWMLLFPCCCSSSDLCNCFSVLTHSSVTIYTPLLFYVAYWGDLSQLCLLLV